MMKKIMISLLLLLLFVFLCGCSSAEEEIKEEAATEEPMEETPFIEPSALAEGSNAINNIPCAGLSYDAGDVLYYVKEAADGSGRGTICALADDGAESTLYTAEGNIEYLIATADKLYFVVTLYKANGHFEEDVFCSMDRNSSEVTEHFVLEDRVIALEVRGDGIYFCTTAERSGGKMMRTDALGREPEVVWEQPDIISDCVFSGDNVYFISNNRIWRSDLNGENKTEVCSSLYMLGAPMAVGNILYFVNYDSYLCPTLNALNFADGIVTPLVSYGENVRISYINLYANQLYLVKSTVDVEGNTHSAEIVSLYTDGSGETQLFAADTEVYGLSIANGNLYYYDLSLGTAVCQPLSVQ